jgi:hypothetical protein
MVMHPISPRGSPEQKSPGIQEEPEDGLTEPGSIQRSPGIAALLRSTTCRVEGTS